MNRFVVTYIQLPQRTMEKVGARRIQGRTMRMRPMRPTPAFMAHPWGNKCTSLPVSPVCESGKVGHEQYPQKDDYVPVMRVVYRPLKNAASSFQPSAVQRLPVWLYLGFDILPTLAAPLPNRDLDHDAVPRPHDTFV